MEKTIDGYRKNRKGVIEESSKKGFVPTSTIKIFLKVYKRSFPEKYE